MSVICMKEYLSNCCVKGKNEETGVEEKYNFYDGAKAMMTTGPLNLLLPCTIIAFISDGMGWNAGITFAFALVAIAPFAERLGFVTEQLALHTNETIGGLLNATFGNATELIVAIAALSLGKYRLVQLSLLGSILSNVLLVLGSAFWLGGYYHKTLTFGKSTAQINCVLLMLGVMGILFPTVLTWTNAETPKNEAGFSRATAVLNFFGYILFLYFQIVTHPDAYDEVNADAEHDKEVGKTDEEEQLLDKNIKLKSSEQSTHDIAKVSPTNATIAIASSTPRTQPENDVTGRGSFASDATGRGSFAIDAGGGGARNMEAAKEALSALMDDDDKNTPRSQDGLFSGMKNMNSTEPHQGKTRGGDVEEGGLKKALEKSTTNDLPSPAVTTKVISIEGLVSNKIEGGADGVEAKHEEEEEEEEEEDILGFWYAIVWLAIITVFISFLSDALVLSIDIASVDWHVSGVFLSTIVIPIIGNAAEHASSIVAACKNKCDLSLGIAVGSSTQISLCVLPLLVIIGWGMDRPMTMNFEPFEAFTLVCTVMILGFAITHGTATWITGAALFIAYLIAAAGFFCHYDEPLNDHVGRR